MGRVLYLVCYDIASPSKLQKVHKQVKAFAIGGQKSFYECWLTKWELMDLKAWFESVIDPKCDRVHFFQLDPRCARVFTGQAKTQSHEPFVVC